MGAGGWRERVPAPLEKVRPEVCLLLQPSPSAPRPCLPGQWVCPGLIRVNRGEFLKSLVNLAPWVGAGEVGEGRVVWPREGSGEGALHGSLVPQPPAVSTQILPEKEQCGRARRAEAH